MKTVLLLTITFLASSLLWAQTPPVKWTASPDTVTGWIQLNGRLYPYYASNSSSRFILYSGISLTQKFAFSLPSGFQIFGLLNPGTGNSEGVSPISDITGDGLEDIALMGNDFSHILLVDGATGAIIYYLDKVDWDMPYAFLVGDVDNDGRNEIVVTRNFATDSMSFVVYGTNGISTGISQNTQNSPTGFQLKQNYPNPFNPSTTITYTLPTNEPVELKLYDVLGREVETLVDQPQAAGEHSVTLNANSLASGVYFYLLQSDGRVLAKKLMVIK